MGVLENTFPETLFPVSKEELKGFNTLSVIINVHFWVSNCIGSMPGDIGK